MSIFHDDDFTLKFKSGGDRYTYLAEIGTRNARTLIKCLTLIYILTVGEPSILQAIIFNLTFMG